jgi:hypothetical protein
MSNNDGSGWAYDKPPAQDAEFPWIVEAAIDDGLIWILVWRGDSEAEARAAADELDSYWQTRIRQQEVKA